MDSLAKQYMDLISMSPPLSYTTSLVCLLESALPLGADVPPWLFECLPHIAIDNVDLQTLILKVLSLASKAPRAAKTGT